MKPAAEAAPADERDEIVDDAAAYGAGDGPRCATCPLFAAPSSDRAKIERVGGVWRGDCRLAPVAVKKAPEDVCGHHPELAGRAASVAAAALAHVLAPILESGFAALARAVETGKPGRRD